VTLLGIGRTVAGARAAERLEARIQAAWSTPAS
jgi:hypothetical protein